MSSKQKVMVQPINVIFRYLQQQTRVSLWLYDNEELRIEGKIVGFDEFMNVVMAEAEEVPIKKESAAQRKTLGRILLKGDNITLIQPAL
ncbi:putative small nuclear ribonucleo protein E [Acaromyces ingoldii]|uniref:Small nuclear ribonucleoprotein E n=1 Tax=Acaromyces ingoldii TaxID=215250 RepID=A0A316YP88_9BASI|nr:putative small nuclear ribonucleo protein E [Acaromyces ingoldii]PWN91099.1 putative small nuclear ribonucleo protein E [Acaromyces ingoldii]